jgi:hypothetical protein
VDELVATKRALKKLAARGLSAEEPVQLPRNQHVIVRNPRESGRRRLLIGSTRRRACAHARDRTDHGSDDMADRDGWSATLAERRVLRRR